MSVSEWVAMSNYRAIQVHGGIGYSRHTPFEHIYRHHRRYRTGDPTPARPSLDTRRTRSVRLEAWAAHEVRDPILRDAVLRTAPQDEARDRDSEGNWLER